MDDVQIPVKVGKNQDELIKQTAEALGKGGFEVKKLIKTGDSEELMKYLLHDYLAKQDKIWLRLKFNMSRKKRGVRSAPDIKSYTEFENMVDSMGLTKETLRAC